MKFVSKEKSVLKASSKDSIFLFGNLGLLKEYKHGKPPDKDGEDDRNCNTQNPNTVAY